MPLVATEHTSSSRSRVLRAYLVQGLVGLAIMVWLTHGRWHETGRIYRELGDSATLVILIFFCFTVGLAILKFALTEQIFVSLVITAIIAMFPLLGPVMASWVAVFAAMTNRFLDMGQLGVNRIDMSDPSLEWIKTFGLFGTYGIPVIVAGVSYEWLGGVLPVTEPSLAAAGRISACAVVLIVSNNLVIRRVERAYGYSPAMSFKLALIDGTIYLLTLPYTIMMTFSYSTTGWVGILASAFTGVLVNLVARNLAVTRAANELQIKRLASLTTIGKTISLSFTTEQLLMTIYTECRKVIDVSMFSISLLDPNKRELCFELDIRDDQVLPKFRVPLGEGLNSWVVENQKPLLLGSAKEEREMGISAVDDGMPTEAWLGVPMIARDQLIGVMSVQSYRRNSFKEDDLVLLTAVANQAAVALKNANLYQDLEALNADLEQRVHDRTIELREANLKLIAADRSKNQFLANMSHELRTPLNSIIGFSSILLDTTKGVVTGRLYKFVENIRDSGAHLLELINDILDLSKIEAGKLEIQLEEFDLRDTIATVERVIKGLAGDANVALTTQVDPDVPRVRLDEGRIKQILLNLLSNAIKFSKEGGMVRLLVSRISDDQSPVGCDSIRLRVEDEGIGIPSDELSRIFDEFYQVDSTRRSGKGGTGLGLSLTRSFVELHSGTIDAESQPGVGSTFTIILPVDYRATQKTRGDFAKRAARTGAATPDRMSPID